MLYEIACDLEFQRQLREEICAIPNPSFDQLNSNLPLLDAALKETLRLHPAILENHHEVCPLGTCAVDELLTWTGRPAKQLGSRFLNLLQKQGNGN
jgi:hypothetical protein